MTQSTSSRDATADPQDGSTCVLDELAIYEKTCLAATLTVLDRQISSFQLDLVLKSDLTGSQFLTLKVLTALQEKELIHIGGNSGRAVTLLTKNNDLVLRRLLADIGNTAMHLDSRNEMVAWTKDTLVAECVRVMCLLAKQKGVEISSIERPPKTIENLVQVRPLNEIKMLCWRAIAQLGASDLRLISVDPSDKGLETLFDNVIEFHDRYRDDRRKVPQFRNQPTYRLSPLSQIIARYFLNLSPQQFESRTLGLLIDGV